jgi:hypothetical protein
MSEGTTFLVGLDNELQANSTALLSIVTRLKAINDKIEQRLIVTNPNKDGTKPVPPTLAVGLQSRIFDSVTSSIEAIKGIQAELDTLEKFV